jgi:hypothetical protein
MLNYSLPLLLLLQAPNFIRLTALVIGDEGGYGSVWVRVSLYSGVTVGGRSLNLVLYIPFKMFAYSSNIFKSSLDLVV